MNGDKPIFSLQWHITSKCDQRCKHCYIFQSNEISTSGEDLEFKDIVKILIDFMDCCTKLNAKPGFAFTGGDPLLRNDFFLILDAVNKETRKNHFDELIIDVMGNPYHLDSKTAKKLKEKNVRRYQISIDGMKEKHDKIRKNGSFDESLRVIRILKQAGIAVNVMFTLSKFNADDLFPLVKLLTDYKIDAFAFARLSRPELMSIDEYKKISFLPLEYRDFLSRVDNLYNALTNTGCKTKFSLKDHLWKLFLYEQGRFSLDDSLEKGIIYSGCGLGIGNLSILADGTVYACRRFPSPVGKVPEQRLIDIFLDSKELNHYRDFNNFVKCKNCELLQYCRGCGSVAYSMSGSFFNPDPQCWKQVAYS